MRHLGNCDVPKRQLLHCCASQKGQTCRFNQQGEGEHSVKSPFHTWSAISMTLMCCGDALQLSLDGRPQQADNRQAAWALHVAQAVIQPTTQLRCCITLVVAHDMAELICIASECVSH